MTEGMNFEVGIIWRATEQARAGIQELVQALRQGGEELSSALQLNFSANPEGLNVLMDQLNRLGDQAVERMRVAGDEIGQALSQGMVPSEALGSRLNTVLRETLAEARQQITQFADTTRILPGTGGAGEIQQFTEQVQSGLVRVAQVFGETLRAELNSAAREMNVSPRAVTGTFQAGTIAGAATRASEATWANTNENWLARLEAQRGGGGGVGGAGAAAAQQLDRAVESLLNEAIRAVQQGQEITAAQAAELRRAGYAVDLRNPANQGIIAPNAPLTVRPLGPGMTDPVVYRAQSERAGGGFAPLDPENVVGLDRELKNALYVWQQIDQNGRTLATSEENLARILAQVAAESASVRQLGTAARPIWAEFGEEGPSALGAGRGGAVNARFFDQSGIQVEDQSQISALRQQLQAGLQRDATAIEAERVAAEEAATMDQRRAEASANLTRLLNDQNAVFLQGGIRDSGGQFFARRNGGGLLAGEQISGQTPQEELQIRDLQGQFARDLRRRNTELERVNAPGPDNSASGLINRFAGGAGGVGFDAHAAFNPQEALGNIAGTAGVLLRYGATGMAISEGFKVVGEIRSSVIDYNTALEHLDEQVDVTKAGQIDLNGILAAAAPAGISAAQAINLAAEALGRYGNQLHGLSANQALQQTLSQTAQAAVLTGQTPEVAQGQVITATQGFQSGPAGQSRILDAVVAAQRQYGGNRADILQAVSSSADLAAQANVTPEQLAYMVSLIQARTGASGSNVASSVERLVSKQGTSTFNQALSFAGVQNTGNLAQEVEQLSKAYNGMSAAQQNALIAGLGGARQAQDLLPLLREGSNLLEETGSKYTGAGGAAAAYAREQATLAGELRQVGGEFRDLFAQLGQSGMFTFLGPLIIGLKDAVGGVDALFHAFNSLPAPLRAAIMTVGELILAVRLLGSAEQQTALGGVLRNVPVVGGFARKVGLPGAGRTVEGATEQTSAETFATTVTTAGERAGTALVDGAERAAAALATGGAEAEAEIAAGGAAGAAGGAAGGLEGAVAGRTAASGFAGLTADSEALAIGGGAALNGGIMLGAGVMGLLANPVTWAIGGLMSIGAISNHMHQLDQATQQGTLALQGVGAARTPDSLRTLADSLDGAAQQISRDTGGPFGTIAGAVSGAGAQRSDYRATANWARTEANRIAAQQTTTGQMITGGMFGPGGTDVSLGLMTMSQRGVDATTQLRAVAEALGLVANQSGDATSSLVGLRRAQTQQPGLRGSEATSLLFGQAVATEGTGEMPVVGKKWGPSGTTATNDDVRAVVDRVREVQGRVSTYFQQHGIDQNTVLSPDQMKAALEASLPPSDYSYLNPLTDHGKLNTADTPVVERARQADVQNFLGFLQGQAGKAVSQQQGPLTNEQLGTLLNGDGKNVPGFLSTIQSARPDAFDPTGGSRKGGPLQNAVAVLQSWANRSDPSGSNYPQLIQALHDAQDKLAQAEIANFERLRQAYETRAKSPAQMTQIDEHYFDQEIVAAGDDVNQLIAVIQNMDAAEMSAEKKLLQSRLAHAKKVFDALHKAAEHDPSLIGEAAAAASAVSSAQAGLDAFNQASQTWVGPQGASGGGMTQAQQARLAQINSQAQPGNPVQDAQTALNAANYQLSIARKNSADWYNAQKAVADAQYQLTQAQASQSEALAQRHVDPGSQLQQAAANITVAREALAAAVPNTAAYYQAQQQLYAAQIAYGQAVIQDQANLRQLHSDMTNPLVEAQNQLTTDTATLNKDRRDRRAPDVIHGDQVKVQQDRNQVAQTRFQQQMDMARAENSVYGAANLGTGALEMSNTAYLNFLEAQLHHLETIKHRTYQQTQDLLSVEQAIKDANQQLSGQFNIGQIMAPTVYAARAMAAGVNPGGQQTQSIQIVVNDYSDAQHAKGVIAEVLGVSQDRLATQAAKP